MKKTNDPVSNAMNAVLEDMRIKAQSARTDDWKPDHTLNRNADLAKIGQLVRDAFDYFHDEEDEDNDGVRDCLFSLLDELYPGACRVAPVDMVRVMDEIISHSALQKEKASLEADAQGYKLFKVGPGEDDIENIESMLMKLATVKMTLEALCNYSEQIAANDGVQEEYIVPVDSWATRAAFESLHDVAHALKCGAWGHHVAGLC